MKGPNKEDEGIADHYTLFPDTHESPDSTFFDKCVTTPCCSDKLNNYTFKTKFDRNVCYLSSCLIFVLLVGIIFPVVLMKIVDSGINKTVIIDSTDAPSYETWQTNAHGDGADVDIGYNVYIFDTQNVADLLQGAKPVVVERGPYAYKEYYNKFDITWSNDGEHVTYTNQKYFIFDPENTGPGLSEDDAVTVPYLTAVGFQFLLATIPPDDQDKIDWALFARIENKTTEIENDIQAAIDAAAEAGDIIKQRELEALLADVIFLEEGLINFFNTSDVGTGLFKFLLCSGNPNGVVPFWTTTPVKAYFGWLNDTILVEVQQLMIQGGASQETIDGWVTSVPGATNNYTTVDDARRRKAPDTYKTGKGNTKETGLYIRSNNMTTQYVCLHPMDSSTVEDYKPGYEYPACGHFQYEWTMQEAYEAGYVLAFATDYANRIAGGDGTLYGRPVDTDLIQVYISDIYRTAYVKKLNVVWDWYNVELFRYSLQMKDLYNISLNPQEAWQYFSYGPSGFENLTAATGVPLFVSKPHFLDCTSTVGAAVKGLVPVRSSHDTYLDIEPRTGLLARAHKRLQLNYYLEDYYLPTISTDTAAQFQETCEKLLENGVIASCLGLDALTTCLAVPSTWTYYQGGVYHPYAWADEYVTMDQDTADQIKEDIYGADELGKQIQLWSYVVAGLCFAMIAGMYLGKFIVLEDVAEGKLYARLDK